MGVSKHFHKKSKNDLDLARQAAKRTTYERIMVVCEGECTEPNYFKGLKNELKLHSTDVEITGDNGSSPKSVVAYAKERYQHEKKIGYPFGKVYCVFDKDQHPGYADALAQIRQMKPRDVFHAIPSVPCFEYFLLLHFDYTTKPFNKCAQVESESKFKKHLPAYQKGDKNIFAAVRDHLETAKARAARSLAAAEQNKTDNPSTKAHELVQHMQDIKRKP